MKKLLFLGMVFMLAACTKQAETSVAAGRDFQVDRLFTVDECTVYRFADSGNWRYFTNCKGTTMTTENCGKNCTREVTVNGGG